MAGFHQKWRYNIRLAAKKGVEVREGTREDLKAFHKIMVETGWQLSTRTYEIINGILW